MPTVKKHSTHGLTAYYLKKGRNWWVETQGDKKCFKSIEDMVDAYLELLEIEAIKTTFERRKFSREFNVGKVEIASITEDKYIESETECYYCNGTGMAGGLPCSNCNGTGIVKVFAKLT